ncbi:EAL domain-containing protein [Bacillus sp. JJ1533]|uniref:sensor domain-containing protein n=1 Tax=Bacillus sp. JJ1533 TaxID=3122959 RepID=UPI002FFFA79E
MDAIYTDFEVNNLISFLKKTGQENVDFLGEDIDIFFWSYDYRTNEMLFTNGIKKVSGYTHQEYTELKLWNKSIYHEDKYVEEVFIDAFVNMTPVNIEYRIIRKDGSIGWVKTKGKPVVSHLNEPIRFNGLTRDITAKKTFDNEIKESKEKYQTLVENSALGVYISQDSKYQFVNQKMIEITGYTESELLEMRYDTLLDQKSKELVLKRVSNFLSGKENSSEEITIVRKNGEKRIVELQSSLITYKNKPALMGTFLDITEKKKSAEQINFLAYYDSLTGVPNKHLFHKMLEKEVKVAKSQNKKLALLYMDFVQLSIINDTYGHNVGDEVLKSVVNQISELVDKYGFITRYNGCEFFILLRELSISEVEGMVEEIISIVPKSLNIGLESTLRIGISLFPEHTVCVDSLIKYANIALHHIKDNVTNGKGYEFYDDTMMRQVERIAKLTGDFQRGLAQGEFYLEFQPKIEIVTKEIKGIEALIRWKHPEFGFISPMEFIPLAEKNGFINQLGDWVLEEAIHHVMTLPKPIMVSVNLSVIQLFQENIVEKLEKILMQTNFPPSLLNLEITEGIAILDINKTVKILERIKSLGIHLSLDDFGTGYSSLSYLSQLPFDYIKIDKSFFDNSEHEQSNQKIIQTIINVSHSLKLKVVAEGIETKEQADALVQFGCDLGQGYYFSKPVTVEKIKEYMLNND